ncbi:hypothetical protein RhiJN_01420 [Ceratobasidium sp. AG-Ba]|nr:hypothetical protein RhiJN_01420 [Ceratobasidium sp. AG-Ba]QRW02410.1 hypothetical protein RhiLY_01408 [Ceratobasidium sp. AG-Ba]
MPAERPTRSRKPRFAPAVGRPKGCRNKKAPGKQEEVKNARPEPTREEKAAYRAQLEERIDQLGWPAESMKFSAWPSLASEWLAVLEPTELNDLNDEIVWNNVKSRLDMLRYRLKAEREKQKELLFERLYRLLSTLEKESPPLLTLQVRRLGKPPCTEYPCPPSGYSDVKTVSQKLAFPRLADVHKLPLIKSMLEADTTADQLEETFKTRRSDIDTMVTEWRNDFHRRLLSFLPDVGGNILEPTLVADDSDPFEGLSNDMKRLLRADSLFSVYDWDESPYTINSSRDLAYTYKDLVRRGSGVSRPSELARQRQLPIDCVGRYDEARVVARELLQSIERPNASYLELECDVEQVELGEDSSYEGEWICGQCINTKPQIWTGIVEHYVKERKSYRPIQAALAKQKTIYCDVHGSEPLPNRPMIRYYSAQVAREIWAQSTGERDVTQCQMCSKRPINREVKGPMKSIVKHLLDIHGIKQPKPGTHYSRYVTSYGY